MVLTPKDRRLISEAVLLLSDPARDRWRQWAGPFAADETISNVPYQIAELALEALNAAEQDLTLRIQQKYAQEDARSDMINDLACIQSIQASIRAENVGH